MDSDKDTMKVRMVEIYETILEVPANLSPVERREYAYIEKKATWGLGVRVAAKHLEPGEDYEIVDRKVCSSS